MTNINNIYQSVKKWVHSTGICGDDEPKLIESADFGKFYGFVFQAKNIYDNPYWCVNKKDLKPFLFLPVQNPKLFNKRKKMIIDENRNSGN